MRRSSPPSQVGATESTRLRRDLRSILGDGVSFSLMVGMGESYLAAFGLAVGLDEIQAGLLATAPMLAGALLQLAGPWGVRRLRSHRRWVVLCAVLQALSFAPLVAAALAGSIPSSLLFLLAALYWASGMSTGPAWNTWVGRLVPDRVRPGFFASRTRAAHAASFLGLLAGGLVLQAGQGSGRRLEAFAVIFLLAGMSRLVSASFLARQSEPAVLPAALRSVSFRDFLLRFRSGRDGRLIAYMLSVQLAAFLAAPFFTPFMLRHLELSYAGYMGLIAAALLGKAAALPALGRMARRRGVASVLLLGGCGIVPVAALWVVSDNYLYLIAAQVYSGAVWAAYELATLLLFFKTIEESERTSFLTIYNLANASAVLSASVLGGLVLGALGGGRSAYLMLFGISSMLRGATLVLLRRLGRPVLRAEPIALRPMAVRPAAGAIDRPILAGMPSAEGEEAGSLQST